MDRSLLKDAADDVDLLSVSSAIWGYRPNGLAQRPFAVSIRSSLAMPS